ncbi:hypothetical protein ABIC20_006341 [Methylobacterium radiotolerans]|uniref:Uncharacterized protein n=1 Tax=Methylobacterium radiotolerans TaxID=31998 RepID=A0ABV2NR80_9HYPH
MDRLEADEAADAVVGVDHEVARLERLHLQDHVLGPLGLALLADQPVAQDVALGDDGQLARGEARLQAPDRHRRVGAALQRVDVGEPGDRHGLPEAVVGEHAAEPVAGAVGPGSQDHVMTGSLEIADMRHRGVEHAGSLVGPLGGEASSGLGAAIDHGALGRFGLREGRQPRHGGGGDPLLQLVRRQVEGAGRQGLVGGDAGLRRLHRALAGLVIVLDEADPLGGGVLHLRIEDQRHAAEIVEQRVEVVVEQRHPVLEAGVAPPLAHGLVEPVVPGRRAEALDVVLAEAPDRLGGELDLAHRHQVEGAELTGGALRLRVEGADRFQRVAEEVEADRGRQARGRQVEDAAADRVLAGVAHRPGAQEAVGLDPGHHVVHCHDVADRRRERLLGDVGAGRDPLHQGVDGGAEDARPVLGRAGAGEAGERRHPGGGDGGGRRDPVVGLAVPGRQAHHVHLGRDEAQSRLERGRAPRIARHVHQHGRCVDGGRQGTGEVGERQRVEALRGVRQDRAVAALEGVDRPGERGGFRQREARDRRLGGGGGGLRLRLGHRVFRGEARRARQGRRSGGVSRSGRRDKASRRKRLGG